MTLSQHMRRETGMTVAIWAPGDTPRERGMKLLRRTLDDAEVFVAPERIVLVVDGCPAMEDATRQAAQEFGARCGAEPRVEIKPNNEGQGGAVACGLEILLADSAVRYCCTRDMDGDHDIYNVPQLYRRLVELEQQESTDRAYVIGYRGDLHRPMGFARGQFEQVLNEVTVRTLTALGRVPNLSHCRVYGQYPDFQSGFKIYTRWSAELTAASLRRAHEREPQELPLRWGVQFISTAELLWEGAVPASVYRLTYDDQPHTTFEGLDDLPRAYGCQLAWLFRRFDVPPEIAWPILDEALAGVLFATTPGGPEVILKLREFVARHAWSCDPPQPPARGAMF